MLIIGSHVSFNKETGLLGSLEEALSYGANTFMFYTGAPQNTKRFKVDKNITEKAWKLMKENHINVDKIIVHAPYIVNLANNKEEEKYQFSINFLISETKRCEELGVKYMVLHPGSHVGLGVETALANIIDGLNIILKDSKIIILLETMAGKGTEVGRTFEEIKTIIDGVVLKDKIGVCLDTCHLNDAGYDLNNFDSVLEEFDKVIGLKYLKCIHINDSKNNRGAHKDRHENIGYGTIGFDNLLSVIYHEKLVDIPKILETPYIEEVAPYKKEIEMIRNKKFNENLK